MSTRRKAQGARRKGASLIGPPSFLALCLALLAPGTALAQLGSDPTRPPTGYATEGPDAEGTSDGGSGMTLQSVLISPTQKAAIISGVMVKLGDKYGDAVLVKVAETEVVLKSGTASQVLKLYPGVEKREIASGGEKGAARRGKSSPGGAPPR